MCRGGPGAILCDEQLLWLVQVVQMKDSLGDGSGCTMLISAWRDSLPPPLQHTRKYAPLAAAQLPSKYELVGLQVTDQGCQRAWSSLHRTCVTSCISISGSITAVPAVCVLSLSDVKQMHGSCGS